MAKIPAIAGKQLINLLVKDGWVEGTLAAILGPRQTGIGKKGLQKLISQYGL